MAQQVVFLSRFRRQLRERDWTQQELAEFYRVESALVHHGLVVSIDRGVSDEGDPWFVFCRGDDGEVIAHIARIGREYVIVSSAFSGVASDADFRMLIQKLVEAHPLMLPLRSAQTGNIFLHPTALLSAIVATAYFISVEKGTQTEFVSSQEGQKFASFMSLWQQKFAILSAIVVAVTLVEGQIEKGAGLAHEKSILLEHSSDTEASFDCATSHVAVRSEHGPHQPPDTEAELHNIDLALAVQDAPAAVRAVPSLALNKVSPPTTSAEKFDASSTLALSSSDVGNAATHDLAVTADAIVTPIIVPVLGSGLINIAGDLHGTVMPVSALPPNLSSDIFSLPLSASSSEAFQIVATDIANLPAQPGHNLPEIIPLSADALAQALFVIGSQVPAVSSISASLAGTVSSATGSASANSAPSQSHSTTDASPVDASAATALISTASVRVPDVTAANAVPSHGTIDPSTAEATSAATALISTANVSAPDVTEANAVPSHGTTDPSTAEASSVVDSTANVSVPGHTSASSAPSPSTSYSSTVDASSVVTAPDSPGNVLVPDVISTNAVPTHSTTDPSAADATSVVTAANVSGPEVTAMPSNSTTDPSTVTTHLSTADDSSVVAAPVSTTNVSVPDVTVANAVGTYSTTDPSTSVNTVVPSTVASVTPTVDVPSPAAATGTPASVPLPTSAPSVPSTATHTTAPTTSMLPVFDAQANQIFETFLQDTPQIAVGTTNGGKSVIMMDTNSADLQNHNYGIAEWQVADGSTLTIIGIIPHPTPAA